MKSKTQRIATEFDDKIKDIMKYRLEKGLAKLNPKELSSTEGTRLLLKTPSWPQVEREMRTLPKKR